MYFTGIDPSLASTGIVIIDELGKLQRSKVISVKQTGPARLVAIRNTVRYELAHFSETPIIDCLAQVCIEHYAMGAKFGRELAGELGGVLRVMMFENEIDYTEIPPLRLKQFATGKATAEKDHILLAVFKKWGVEFKTNDEADAFILAQMARVLWTVKSIGETGYDRLKLTAYERDVINNILNPTTKPKKKSGRKIKSEAA
jgi:crossover junction endodeoxyribonuclease RuvC